MQPRVDPSQDEPTVREPYPWLAFSARFLLPGNDSERLVGDGWAGKVEDASSDDVTGGLTAGEETEMVGFADVIGVEEATAVVFLRRPVGRTVRVNVVTISISSSSSSSVVALGFSWVAEDEGKAEGIAA